MTDPAEELHDRETLQDVAAQVAKWLLLDGCSNRVADQRVHEIAGSLPQVRSIVGTVNATLKSGCGPSYKRLPKKERLARFDEIEAFIRKMF